MNVVKDEKAAMTLLICLFFSVDGPHHYGIDKVQKMQILYEVVAAADFFTAAFLPGINKVDENGAQK